MNLNHAKLIAYDITDDKKRLQAAKLLEKVGLRIQKSVFLVAMRNDALDKVIKALEKLRGQDDVIDIVPVCAKCRHKSRRLGTPPEPVIFITGEEEL